jgi:hypothetical protein
MIIKSAIRVKAPTFDGEFLKIITRKKEYTYFQSYGLFGMLQLCEIADNTVTTLS